MHDVADDLRSRRDLWAVAFALVWPTAITLVYFVWLAGRTDGMSQAAFGLGKLIQFAFPAVWVACVQKRRLGWHWPRQADFVQGLLLGAVILLAALASYHLVLKPAGAFAAPLESVRLKVADMGLTTLPRYAALGVSYVFIHSLLEEYYWRWFVFGQLQRQTTLPVAVVVSSVGFMAHHVVVLAQYFGGWSWLTVLFSLAVAVGGAIWALVYHRTRSLFGPWFCHALVDAAIFLIGYDLLRDTL